MAESETPLEMCERHLAEGEVRVARQEAILKVLARHKHQGAAATARRVLGTLQESLRLARLHTERLKNVKSRGGVPDDAKRTELVRQFIARALKPRCD